ncbi:hypothetical protein CBM2605_B130326 [Cupriavidus neocaledonicus]|uniref:Uncharacterized protein n=1 Tax=Cupriavidus neocaledonicus TaxID=1040979 RepID=A0ABY1V959_9BURK|nr:hypothetical protein CBM2605_B130326 [Cupriavidus neocaledonicus]
MATVSDKAKKSVPARVRPGDGRGMHADRRGFDRSMAGAPIWYLYVLCEASRRKPVAYPPCRACLSRAVPSGHTHHVIPCCALRMRSLPCESTSCLPPAVPPRVSARRAPARARSPARITRPFPLPPWAARSNSTTSSSSCSSRR